MSVSVRLDSFSLMENAKPLTSLSLSQSSSHSLVLEKAATQLLLYLLFPTNVQGKMKFGMDQLASALRASSE